MSLCLCLKVGGFKKLCGHGGIKAVSAWVVLCKISLLSLWSSNFLPRDYATLREALTRATGLDFTAHRTLTYLYKSLGQGSQLTETNTCFQSAHSSQLMYCLFCWLLCKKPTHRSWGRRGECLVHSSHPYPSLR